MTGYFNKFPYTFYTIDGGASYQIATNILRRVKILDVVKNNASTFFEYKIADGDTPENIAHKLYGDSKYFWVIYHMNDMINPYLDWPMTQTELMSFVTKKYEDVDGIHHYEDALENWVNSTTSGATAITNYVYEEKLNEAKRDIKILLPEFVGEVQNEFEKYMKIKID